MRRSHLTTEIQSRSFQRPADGPLMAALNDSRLASNDDLNPVPTLFERLGFNVGPLILVSRRRNWSPSRVLGELWCLLTNVRTQREILRLLKLRPFAETVPNNPELPFKYLIPDYLVQGLTVAERACCFSYHYRRMHSALPEEVLRGILQGEIVLYEIAKDGNRFGVTMGLSRYPHEKEGELSLNLQVDGEKVFNLSFTIVPGWVLKSGSPEALLISRLQGKPGCNCQIRLVRKALKDYSPRILLVTALQGIADAFGIGEMVAVCAARQRSYGSGCPAILMSGYDDFFSKLGMVKTADGFYSSPIPTEGKPLILFKGRARSRARKRRANRQQIREACAAFLFEITGRAAESVSGAAYLAPVRAAVASRQGLLSCSTPDYNRNL